MPSSHHSSDSYAATCVGCGADFVTRRVTLLGLSFPEDRYCEVCRVAFAVNEREQEVEARWKRARIPTSYADCSFANFEPMSGTEHSLGVARQWAKEFRAGTSLRRGLLLYGPPGAGKTHLTVAILRELVWSDRRPTALFLSVPEWLNALRESYGADESEPPPNPSGYSVVVLDDLGAEHWSSWARDRIYGIVNHREQERLLTFVTTNCTPGELAARVGGPAMSRIARLCREEHVDARQDYRGILASRDESAVA